MCVKLFASFLLLLSSISFAAVIESIPVGGEWNKGYTWVGREVPGPTDSVVIKGTVFVTASTSCGSLTIDEGAFLENGGTLGWVVLTVNGTITNNGTIKNNDSGNELWINADGDIINNGVWKCAKTGILSNKVQHISQASNTEFNGIIWKCNTSSYAADTFPLIASSDIVINVSDFDGKGSKAGEDFWGVFDLNNHSLTLKGATKLHKTELKNVKSLTGMDSSTIYSVNVYNPVELSGRITVTDANVTFYGDVTVKDTLQNGGTLGWITLNVNKGIVNNGTVRDNPEGNELWLSIRGDVTNRAIWSNSKNTLLDSIDQTISIGVGKSITGPVFLDALWSEGPYQWCKDGVNLDKANGRTLSFETLSESNLGIYQCKKNDVLSRNITIKHGDPVKVSRPGIEQAAFKSEIPFNWNLNSTMGNKLVIQTPVTRSYSLKLFAANGRLVSSYNGIVNRGRHSVPLEIKSSGTYLVRFESENILETRKMIISK